MASPPYTASPTAMSPPYPSPAQLPNKKRSATFDVSSPGGLTSPAGPPIKRRKASIISVTSSTAAPSAHPLRQTSFPPEVRSPAAAFNNHTRSPSVDTASHVSGSAVSGSAMARRNGRPKTNKRPRKSKGGPGKGRANDSQERTPSLAGGSKAPTNVSGGGGTRGGGDRDRDAEDDDDEDRAEMALEDVVARTQEQKQEEVRLRAMLVEAFDSEQYDRYELWRAAKLSDAIVKRVVNATVSQSVPQMVTTAVKAVAKLFAGEIIEEARRIQAEWIHAGETQIDLPTPPDSSAALEGIPAIEDSAPTEQDEAKEDEEEVDLKRGPLRPDHLREAWRRYQLSGESCGVGVQQLWHSQQGSGVERFSTKTRKQIFK